MLVQPAVEQLIRKVGRVAEFSAGIGDERRAEHGDGVVEDRIGVVLAGRPGYRHADGAVVTAQDAIIGASEEVGQVSYRDAPVAARDFADGQSGKACEGFVDLRIVAHTRCQMRKVRLRAKFSTSLSQLGSGPAPVVVSKCA